MTKRPELKKKAIAKLPDNRWKNMLVALAELHDGSIHKPNNVFKDIWVEIGQGYHVGGYNRYSFGHWDLVQTAMDALCYNPPYARLQVEQYFSLVYTDGMFPGTIYSKDRNSLDLILPKTPMPYSHPPLWQEFANDYYNLTGDKEFLKIAFNLAKQNLAWWQKERRAPEGGFYYLDVVKRWWESGVDDGIRWDEIDGQPHACIDASCHIYSIIRRMEEWASVLGGNANRYAKQAREVKNFINDELWDEKTNFFYDVEMVRGSKRKIKSYEGFWPLALGAADAQKQDAIVNHLMSPKEFFSYHPIATVAMDEPEYSKNCWRGPAWNGPNFWIIRGCKNCGFEKEAYVLGARVLDACNARFKKFGAFFEFYNSFDESMEGLTRKHESRGPCRDYLGHNPLNAIFWQIAEVKN